MKFLLLLLALLMPLQAMADDKPDDKATDKVAEKTTDKSAEKPAEQPSEKAAGKPAEDPAAYYVPPPQFNAALQIMDQGFSNLFALFQNATGSFMFDEGTKNVSHIRVALDATSLTSSNVEALRDLSSLLGIMQHSEIRVVAPDSVTFSDNKAEVKATLTLHGVSKPVTFDATLNHVGKSPNAGGLWSKMGPAVGLSLKGTIKRADFGMADDPEVPSRFGDSMTLMLEMQGLRQ